MSLPDTELVTDHLTFRFFCDKSVTHKSVHNELPGSCVYVTTKYCKEWTEVTIVGDFYDWLSIFQSNGPHLVLWKPLLQAEKILKQRAQKVRRQERTTVLTEIADVVKYISDRYRSQISEASLMLETGTPTFPLELDCPMLQELSKCLQEYEDCREQITERDDQILMLAERISRLTDELEKARRTNEVLRNALLSVQPTTKEDNQDD